jgi:predicted outer membrane repeat protein
MYDRGNEGASSPTLTNVTFNGNWAGSDGGAMYNNGASGGASSPTLTNVTFSDNLAGENGGAISNNGGRAGGVSSPTLTNVILWGNIARGDGDQMHNEDATPALGYSLVEGGWDGSGIYNVDSSVTDNGGNIDADPQFLDADDGNLRLRVTSPAIDAGDNTAVPPGVTTDRDGHARFVDIPTVGDTGNGKPPIVDMGAYEAQNLEHHVHVPMILRGQR